MSAGAAPSGLVTLVVASTERSPGRGRKPRGKTAGTEEPEATTRQWCCQWSGGKPGPVITGCEGEPDLTLTLSPEDANLVLSGELAPSVAYMRGRLKTAGDNALLLGLLRWSATEEFRQALDAWRSAPELRPSSSGPVAPAQ